MITGQILSGAGGTAQVPAVGSADLFGAEDADAGGELEDPGEEGRADRDLDVDAEVLGVRVDGPDTDAEMVDDRVHHVVVAEEADGLVVSLEHAEGLFGEAADAEALRAPRGGDVQDLGDVVDAVDAEDGDFTVLVGPADDVIVVAVPGQGVGAEDIGFAAVFELPALVGAVVVIAEADPAAAVDGGVQGVGDVIDLFVARLDAIGEGGVAPQVFRLGDGRQRDELGGQVAALLLGDEPAGLDRVDEELQLGGLEEAGAVIIAVLGGLDDRDVVAGLPQGGDIALHGDAEGRDLPAGHQLFLQLHDADGMLLVGFVLQDLQGPQQADSSFLIGQVTMTPFRKVYKIP